MWRQSSAVGPISSSVERTTDCPTSRATDGHATTHARHRHSPARRPHASPPRAVIITTGTFLNGLIHCGEQQYPAGRSGEPAAVLLGEALKKLGLRGCRLKTGTPPRLDGRTIDWSRFKRSRAMPTRRRSAFAPGGSRITTAGALLHRFHDRRNPPHHSRERPSLARCTAGRFSRSGRATARRLKTRSSSFPTRLTHQLFLEPEGLNTHEIYVNGMSTSLPIDVQLAILKSIPGLENAEMMRPGYAIEYDSIDPTELSARWRPRRLPACFSPGRSMGPAATKKRRARESWRESMRR